MKKLLKHKYEIKKYTWFDNPETSRIEQKIIISKAYTKIDFMFKLFVACLVYDDVDYEIIN